MQIMGFRRKTYAWPFLGIIQLRLVGNHEGVRTALISQIETSVGPTHFNAKSHKLDTNEDYSL